MKPTIINNLDIAKSPSKISGNIPLDSCERLVDVVIESNDHTIQYEMQGLGSKYHLPSFNLAIEASLLTTCQRCLEPISISIKLSFDYVLIDFEPEPFEGDDELDWLEVSREMNLTSLIEDELLMAMPLAPSHSYSCKPSQFESGEKHNPFSALKGWSR